MKLFIGVDVGGTKTAWGLVSETGTMVHEERFPTPSDPSESLARVEEAIHAGTLRAGRALAGIGLGVPAALERGSDVVRFAPNLGWRNVNLRDLVGDVGVPVTVLLDGHAAALGEAWLGAGRFGELVAYFTFGTGIGGGIVYRGQLIEGASRLSGVLGWVRFDVGEPEPSSGTGWLEAHAAGPAIAQACKSSSAAEVFARAQLGDERAKAVINSAATLAGLAVANAVAVLNPDCVIIGGSIGMAEPFFATLRETCYRYVSPFMAEPLRIERAALGQRAGVIGAARAAMLAGVNPTDSETCGHLYS